MVPLTPITWIPLKTIHPCCRSLACFHTPACLREREIVSAMSSFLFLRFLLIKSNRVWTLIRVCLSLSLGAVLENGVAHLIDNNETWIYRLLFDCDAQQTMKSHYAQFTSASIQYVSFMRHDWCCRREITLKCLCAWASKIILIICGSYDGIDKIPLNPFICCHSAISLPYYRHTWKAK